MSVINTNTQALVAARNINQSQDMLSRSLARLSSGSKIVNPSDDAAGLAVSEKLGAQSKRIKAAVTNVQNAISYVQTTDGFMSGMSKFLSRLSELAIYAKDVTKNSTDIALYAEEFRAIQDQLRETIGGTTAEIGGATDIDTPLGAFNGITLFGPKAAGLTVTVGHALGQEMTVAETNFRQGAVLDIIHKDASGNYTFGVNDANSVGVINDGIQQVATQRASLGASQSRLELAASTLQVEFENLGAAISRIRDVDVAEESTNYAKYSILVQSGTAMLAQANQTPKSVLQLLQN